MVCRSFTLVHLVLRRLDVDEVRDAVLRVEPVGRRGLAAARQGREGVIGDVATRSARSRARRSACEESSKVGWPMICWMRTSALPAIVLHARRELASHRRSCCRRSRPLILDVDRRRQAEVQDLGRDVARQEAELRAGKAFRQAGAQRLPVAERPARPGCRARS